MNWQDLIYSFINILNEMSPYILLGFLIAGLLHIFVNEATLTRHLSGKGWRPVIKAAAIGVPLPLCSCGVLPTAVSLRRQGASKAATTSFLIATPQTGVDSIAATYSLLGLAFAVIRPVAALAGAVFGGLAVGKFDGQSDSSNSRENIDTPLSPRALPFHKKLAASVRYGFGEMIDNMGKWLIIGLVVATLITVFIPDSLFVGLRQYPLVAMIVVVIIAVPMYICATGSIPIAMSLMLKGLTPGIAFVLLMAGPAANFASIVILNRTLGRKSTAIYVGSVIITAIAFGLFIDYCLPPDWFVTKGMAVVENCHLHLNWFDTTCSILLVILLIFSAIRTIFAKKQHHNHHNELQCDTMRKEYKIMGMNCNHCRASVEKAIAEVEGVDEVFVDLSSSTATVVGDANPDMIEEAVRKAGFDINKNIE